MLSKRERLLLTALGWTVVLAGMASFLVLSVEPLAGLSDRVYLMEEQLQAHRAVDPAETTRALAATDKAIAAEQAKFYRPGEIDPYRFGALVRDLLVREGLAIQRYQTVEAGEETLLEFAVTGDGRSLFSFLRQVSSAPKYWSMTLLSIKAPSEGQTVQAVFRVRYEALDETDP